MNSALEVLLTTVFFRLPHLAIYAAGLFLASSRRRTLGPYWMLVATGCGVLLVTWVATTGIMGWQMIAIDRGAQAASFALVSGILQNLVTVLSAAGMALVLAGALRIGPKSYAAAATPGTKA
jgi:hypothetical protein